MATETGYNGWTNKPTWLVKLWIDNDQSLQEYWLQEARSLPSEGGALADNLKESFEADADEYGRPGMPSLVICVSFFSDLMSWALAQVEWREIAESLIEDAQEVPA